MSEHTPGPWVVFRMVHDETQEPLTPEQVGEYVVNSIKKSAEESGTNDFLFVATVDKDGPDICHVGNGPRGPINAALIAKAPDMQATIQSQADKISSLEREHAELMLLHSAVLRDRGTTSDMERIGFKAGWAEGLERAAVIVDQLWDQQVKHRPKVNYLREGLSRAYRFSAVKIREEYLPPGNPETTQAADLWQPPPGETK